MESFKNLDRQARIIIVAVLGVLFACASFFVCISGLLWAWAATDPPTFETSYLWGPSLGSFCVIPAFIAVPVVFYFLLLYTQSGDEAETPLE